VKLTEESKAYIDSLDYEGLLRAWREAPAGDFWFQGETGDYWGKRMTMLKAADPRAAVAASKSIGW